MPGNKTLERLRRSCRCNAVTSFLRRICDLSRLCQCEGRRDDDLDVPVVEACCRTNRGEAIRGGISGCEKRSDVAQDRDRAANLKFGPSDDGQGDGGSDGKTQTRLASTVSKPAVYWTPKKNEGCK